MGCVSPNENKTAKFPSRVLGLEILFGWDFLYLGHFLLVFRVYYRLCTQGSLLGRARKTNLGCWGSNLGQPSARQAHSSTWGLLGESVYTLSVTLCVVEILFCCLI